MYCHCTHSASILTPQPPVCLPACLQDFQFYNVKRLTELFEKENSHEVFRHTLAAKEASMRAQVGGDKGASMRAQVGGGRGIGGGVWGVEVLKKHGLGGLITDERPGGPDD